MGISLSRAKKTVKFVSLMDFCFVSVPSSRTVCSHQCYSTPSWYLPNLPWSPQILIDLSNFVFFCIVIPASPIFYIHQQKTICNIQLRTQLSFSNTVSSFFFKVCGSSISITKMNNLCPHCLYLSPQKRCLHISKSSFELLSSIFPTAVTYPHF